MTLTTEDLGDFPDVTPAALDRTLAEDGFGKFAVLSATESAFIQAACDWQPSPECKAFLALHRSDPWLLEYRDQDSGKQFQATGHVTLTQVRAAFTAYLAGTSQWKDAHPWHELKLDK